MMYTISNPNFIASMSDIAIEAIICNIFFSCVATCNLTTGTI